MGFPGGSVVKNPPSNTGDMGSIPGMERSSGEGNGHPLRVYLGPIIKMSIWQPSVFSWMMIKMLLIFIKMAILIFGEFHYYCEDAKPKNLALACSL